MIVYQLIPMSPNDGDQLNAVRIIVLPRPAAMTKGEVVGTAQHNDIRSFKFKIRPYMHGPYMVKLKLVLAAARAAPRLRRNALVPEDRPMTGAWQPHSWFVGHREFCDCCCVHSGHSVDGP